MGARTPTDPPSAIIQMPGSMDGLKLAAAIWGRWPPIKIVATSGLPKISEELAGAV